MVQENVGEFTQKAQEAVTENLNKALEAFSLATEVNRNVSDRAVEVSAAIAREGVQALGDVQGTIRQASEEARDLWARQLEVAQEYPKDVVASSQKAVALYWEGGKHIARLGDLQRTALTRFTGNVQSLLEKAGLETQETLTKYTEKLLALYGLKS